MRDETKCECCGKEDDMMITEFEGSYSKKKCQRCYEVDQAVYLRRDKFGENRNVKDGTALPT